MKYLVVIDTNVIVSALLSKHKDAATVQVLDAVFDRKIIPIYNDEILEEYTQVLHRQKFRFSSDLINTVLSSINRHGIFVSQTITEENLPDPKDLVFYEVCITKRDENSMLVTGNRKHFPVKPFIVTPKELLEIISE